MSDLDSRSRPGSGAPRPSRRRVARWVRPVLFTVVIWIILVGLLEGGLRLAGIVPAHAISVAPRYAKFLPDPEMIWRLKPDWDGLEFNDAPVHTNSLGLRGTEPAASQGASGFRILFVGDSVTYGHNVADDQTVPWHLQEELRRRTGRNVEVVNAGVPGYSTFQEVVAIRRYGQILQPDLVLVGFCLNDVTERYTSLAAFGGPRYFMLDVDTAVGLSWPRRAWLASAIREGGIRLLRGAARRGEGYRLRALWESPDDPRIREAWRTTLSEIDAAAVETSRLGVPVAVVIYPHARQVERDAGLETPQRTLVEHLDRRHVPELDLLPALRTSSLRMEQLFLDVTHLSVRGTEVAARRIAGYLVQANLVPGGEPARP
ncbi:MAG: SGNH/GDSL hydrolase family protein [Acidobacteriota bacterium]